MNINKCGCKENLPPTAGGSGCNNAQNRAMPMNSFKVPAAPVSRPLCGKVNETKEHSASQNKEPAKIEEKKKTWSISDFDLGRAVAKGKFGNVYFAREKESRYVVRLKVLFKSQILDSADTLQVQREVKIQCSLRHPNILRMYGHFQDEKRIYLIMEYAKQSSLDKLLKERERFDEKTVAIYIRDLSKALVYCHTMNVIHRDIKPENLLICDNSELKIADFGLSVHSPSSSRMTLCGTLNYLAPEIIKRQPYSYAVDIWSLGVLCYELLVGKTPFNARDHRQTSMKIRYVIIKYPDFISDKAKDLIGKLLVLQPEKRLSLLHVLLHPWITENAPEGTQPPAFNPEQK